MSQSKPIGESSLDFKMETFMTLIILTTTEIFMRRIFYGDFMKNPSHPGESIRLDCIEPLGLTVTAAASCLGVSRQALNNVLNGKSGISAEMAIRLGKVFGGSAESWLNLQGAYDLAQARKIELNVKRYRRTVERDKVAA